MVEHHLHTVIVGSSSLSITTKIYASVAQLENVPSYEVERWGFESLQTHQLHPNSSGVEQTLDKR